MKSKQIKAWQQATMLGVLLLATLFLVLAGADLGMVVGSTSQSCALQFPRWFGCVLANHEGLSGGLIGGGGALFAAWTAWSAVMRQIQSDRKMATLKEDTAYEAIKIELGLVVDIVTMFWRVVDAALAQQGPERQTWRDNGAAVLKAIYPGPDSLTKMVDNELGRDLDPIRRKKFARVVEIVEMALPND